MNQIVVVMTKWCLYPHTPQVPAALLVSGHTNYKTHGTRGNVIDPKKNAGRVRLVTANQDDLVTGSRWGFD